MSIINPYGFSGVHFFADCNANFYLFGVCSLLKCDSYVICTIFISLVKFIISCNIATCTMCRFMYNDTFLSSEYIWYLYHNCEKYLCWNRGASCSFHNTCLTIEGLEIRYIDHLYDFCRLTDKKLLFRHLSRVSTRSQNWYDSIHTWAGH